jgi:hypothetical protein
MKTIAWGMLVAALACGAGCARPDWIEQTLVTVDVTGTWQRSSSDGWFELVLEQQGPKVNGSVRITGLRNSGNAITGPIEGAVSGDVFTFRQTNGPFTGETTVSGDEMIGRVQVFNPNSILLRRVGSSSRPNSP